MKEKQKQTAEHSAEQDELYAVPHTGFHVNLIAAIVCILLAVVVWLGVMNTEDTDYLALRVVEPQEGCVYTLSVETVQVRGKVSVLKNVGSVGVVVSGYSEGTHQLTYEDLILPQGIELTGNVKLMLTVSAA